MDATNKRVPVARGAGGLRLPTNCDADSTTHDAFDRVRDALRFIPVGGHDDRVRIAFSLKSELGDGGFDIWDEWYRGRGQAYDLAESKVVWKSAKANGKVTGRTLFHQAKANGWRDDGTCRKLTSEELEKRRRIAAERATQEEAEIARERAEAAKKADAIWKAATQASADHPYLSRKRVSPVATLREIDAIAAAEILGYAPKSGGDQLAGRLLVAPVKIGERLSTCELIDLCGRKAALRGRGTKASGFWAAQPLPGGDGTGLTMLLGEGLATVLCAREATGSYAVAALSGGNLPKVATFLRKRYPAARLVVLADFDKCGAINPGAIKAAQAASGLLAVPRFTPDQRENASDFNDLARLRGTEAVRGCIDAAESTGKASLRISLVATPNLSERRFPNSVRCIPKSATGSDFPKEADRLAPRNPGPGSEADTCDRRHRHPDGSITHRGAARRRGRHGGL